MDGGENMRGYIKFLAADIAVAYGKKKGFFPSDIFFKKYIIAFQ
jgi:hypothetical protein